MELSVLKKPSKKNFEKRGKKWILKVTSWTSERKTKPPGNSRGTSPGGLISPAFWSHGANCWRAAWNRRLRTWKLLVFQVLATKLGWSVDMSSWCPETPKISPPNRYINLLILWYNFILTLAVTECFPPRSRWSIILHQSQRGWNIGPPTLQHPGFHHTTMPGPSVAS